MTLSVPDRVFGVGNGGITLVTSMLGYRPDELQDEDVENNVDSWLLDDILSPQAGKANELTVQLLDTATATSEVSDVEERKEKILQLIDDRESVYQKEATQGTDESRGAILQEVGEVDINYEIITEDLRLKESLDLTGPHIVEEITERVSRDIDPDNWPLENGDVPETLDFTDGVFRQRGIAKGVFYKALARDRYLDEIIDMPTEGEVAIVVGLGGGTGAGIAIDIAREIQRSTKSTDVVLWGVLPSREEQGQEGRVHANAYAHLSELEYLCQDNPDLFKDIILLPIDATEYEGKGGDTATTAPDLHEYDKAWTYSFLSYYNADEEGAFGDTSSTAPFTIAVPQVLRYNVRAIEAAENRMQETLDHLEQQITLESEFVNQVRQYLTAYTGEGDLTDDQRDRLHSQLEWFEEFASQEFCQELEYTAATTFLSRLADAREESDDITDQIGKLNTLTESLDSSERDFVDEADRRLAKVLRKAVVLLDHRESAFRKLAGAEFGDDDIGWSLRRGLSRLLDIRATDATDVRLSKSDLENDADELTDKRASLEAELADVTEQLESIKAEHREKKDTVVDQWLVATEELRNTIVTVSSDTVAQQLRTLENELRSYSERVEQTRSPGEIEQVDASDVYDQLTQVEQTLADLEYDTALVSDIETAIEQLESARELTFQATADVGLLAKFLPWNTRREQSRNQARKRVQETTQQLKNGDVFKCGGKTPDDFAVQVTLPIDSIIDEIESHRESLVDKVIADLTKTLDGELPQTPETELRRAIEQDQAVESVAQDAVEAVLSTPSDLQTQKTELEQELETIKSREQRLTDAVELFESLTNDGKLEQFEQATTNVDRLTLDRASVTNALGTDSEYTYLKHVQPDDILRRPDGDGLGASGILEDALETSRFEQFVDELAENVIEYRYNGLRQRYLSTDTTHYQKTKLNIGYLSPAISSIDADRYDVTDELTDAFGLRSNSRDCSTWTVQTGKAWDFALTVFIDGVFLDNIRNLPIYQDGYERRQQQAGDHIHLHHSLGLLDGWFVRRNRLMSLGGDELTIHIDDDGDTLIDEYHDKRSIPPSSTDPD